MAYTYILKCADGTYYIGWTNNLENRINTHNQGKGAKYTRGRIPVKLVYWEEHENRSLAQKREMALRKLSRQEKENLINKYSNIRKNIF
ncbi:MAG: GIY-YIG nuclease family protein [Clostridiales bacterium]|nr:GIY-YIG nuclease family protein [Clostridiales bacterium]